MASIMNHTRAVRREDLVREAEDQADGNAALRRDDGEGDEEAIAARAALDAYMMDTLGLQLHVPPPPPPPPKHAARVAEKSKKKKGGGDDGDESDESMESSDDDDETKDSKTISKDEKAQKTGGATEFVFRLFHGSGKAAARAQNTDDTSAPKSSKDAAAAPAPIVLLDDADGSELLGPGGLLNPPRPLSFYLAGEPTPEALERYSQVAVSGEDIVKASRETRTWGWEVPWRARTALRASSKAAMRALLANALAPEAAAALPENLAVALASATNALPAWAASSQSPEPTNPLPLLRQPDDTTAAATKHRRPGKRRRIVIRKREQERREKAAKAAAQAQSKEEHLSEKKKRLNRIKKLRRREKKRAEKGGEGGGDGGDDSGDDSGGD